jgi:peptide-methionine (S)-S-oxide reductase
LTDQNGNNNGLSRESIAYLAGGCFWCIEAVFADLRGVSAAESGYMGGQMDRPTYEQVCTGRTGHAEVVRVTFDPAVISYADLLEVFFAVHDPTTLNRQGADVGTQYRSAIFYADEAQRAAAHEAIEKLITEKAFPSPIVTEVTPAGPYFRAEAFHDDYFARNPGAGYCRMVIAPKVAKFQKQFGEKLQAQVASSH